jgi:hypothetical protein
MGKLSISIPAPRNPSAQAFYPGLMIMWRNCEQALQTYNGINLASTNGSEQGAGNGELVNATEPAPTINRPHRRGVTGRKWTAAQRQAASARAKAAAKGGTKTMHA